MSLRSRYLLKEYSSILNRYLTDTARFSIDLLQMLLTNLRWLQIHKTVKWFIEDTIIDTKALIVRVLIISSGSIRSGST